MWNLAEVLQCFMNCNYNQKAIKVLLVRNYFFVAVLHILET